MNQMNVIKSIESLREYIERVNSIGKGEDTFAVIDDDLFRTLFPDPDDYNPVGEGWRMGKLDGVDICALFEEEDNGRDT